VTPIVAFEQVGKRYKLDRDRPRSFREVFVRRRLAGRAVIIDPNALWALRDVSFGIERGETVGLIGSNGAGKSTALKLISRVVLPNEGRVIVGGRVAALLELGSGFHPDLSGRDNIYLSGALSGMGRAEMSRKYDAIVDFAELADFIETPVKHYSSGMFARLAFAVSIHIDPEVLLVDEALAVGDHAFQRKCLDRIAEMTQSGVTICLVSHSAEIVRSMCTRAIWLDHGRVMADGDASWVVLQYLTYSTEQEATRLAKSAEAKRQASLANDHQGRKTTAGETSPTSAALPVFHITRVRILNTEGREQILFETGESLTLELEYQADGLVPTPVFGMAVHRHDGVHVTGPNTAVAGLNLATVQGRGVVRYEVPALPLLDGLYHISVAIVNHDDSYIYDYHDRLYPFRVLNQSGQIKEHHGMVTLRGVWQHIPAVRPEPEIQV
jgi:ABC-type polysaccharide/polyol phosphate transport system ATPase subunit